MTVDTCFWCLKPFDDTIKFDKERDQITFSSYEPCKHCQEIFSKGIHVMGVSKEPYVKNQPGISQDNDGNVLYPTGSTLVVSEDVVKEWLDYDDVSRKLLDNVLEYKVLMLPEEAMSAIVAPENTEAVPSLIEDEDLEKKVTTAGVSVSGDIPIM